MNCIKLLKRSLSLTLTALLIVCTLAGCSSKTEKVDFIYPFNADIRSFDPQVASTAGEFLIIENCFEGLVRVNDDGSVQSGVAKSWEISKDGKTYTFYLRKGAKWNVQSLSKEELTAAQELMGKDFNPDVTAHDFVFALRRAADKNTQSPLYSSVSNIVNAAKVHSGKMNTSKLGVRAIDDYTLEIKLNSADDGFLSTLSTAVAMPCNEEYFNATKGRYGLGLDYTIFNGQFYLSSILEASYILRNNKQYVGDYPSKVTDITLVIQNEETQVAKKLKSGYFDCAYITGQEYEQLKDSGISATAYSDKLLAFLLNKNSVMLSNAKLRRAVCLGISDLSLDNIDYLQAANGYVPPSCLIENESASKVIGNVNTKNSKEKSIELWRQGLTELGLSKADFNVICTSEYEPYVKELVQGIQASIGSISSYGDNDSKISFTMKINVLDEQAYNDALATGDYDLAFVKFTAATQNPLTFLESIIDSNYAGIIPNAEKKLAEAQKSSINNLAAKTKECEKAIIEDYSIKPVFFESSYYAQAKGVSGVSFHPGSGRVCFVNATREN